ncbi:MAG: hypothetical protein DSY55_01565 [Clostridia bacterium]|nr:MAG: hypothetical protein DSY55_01565 [Clostridia bacterium]
MKRPSLLLLTSSFPFGAGEEFLETEISYLAQRFDVTIAPLSQHLDFDKQRSLPAGVDVRPDILAMLPVGKKKTLQWLLRRPESAANVIQILLHECLHVRCRPALLRALLRFITLGIRLSDVLGQFIGSQPVDIVYSYWLSAGAFAAGQLKKKGVARIAISRAHRGDLYHERSAIGYLPGQAPTLMHLDKIFCISEHGADYLRKRYPNHRHKIELSRLGVRPASVKNTPSQDKRLHLVSCAYLSSVKRIDLVVNALAQCEIPVTWTHLGGGKLESEIRTAAEKLPHNIQWRITGSVPNWKILQFYQENPVDLFINVSASEGLPVSIMEAMSYSIPVAATDVGGNRELVSSGQGGILLPADITPPFIARTLTDFYKLPSSQKQQMRQAAWQTWHDTVNAEVQYPKFVHRLSVLI